MKSPAITKLAGALAALTLGLAAAGAAQAAVYTEDFEAPFPAWESGWFGTLSNARNYFCNGNLGCAIRNGNNDGLWIISTDGGVAVPVTVSFDNSFGASLSSFKLDVAGYAPTTLTAYDKDGNLIFNQDVTLTFGAGNDPGVYSTYTVTSSNGISRFSFSGSAAGNTSIDNLVAITTAVPEPASVMMMLVGLAGLAASTRRRSV